MPRPKFNQNLYITALTPNDDLLANPDRWTRTRLEIVGAHWNGEAVVIEVMWP